jgi:ketosteroid isomerase-like protein
MRAKPELLADIYAAFNRRDTDAVLAWMHLDVDWPNGMEGGRVHGRDAVRAYWTRQWALIDPRVEPVSMEEDESGTVLVDVHQVVRDKAGSILKDQRVHHLYSFRDGLIERMDIQEPESEQAHPGSH